MEDHQNGAQSNDPALPAAGQLDSVSSVRRRFAKSSLAASGVLLTLASRPVLGNVVCKSPSGFLSGNQSSQGMKPICEGRSPGYWRNHDGWPIPKSTIFKEFFNCRLNAWYARKTFGDLIDPQSQDKHNFIRHLVAATLNERRGWTPFLTEQTLRSMLAQWENTGKFSPKPNVYWDAEQIVVYLSSTQA